tara:strand:- start:485 stop:727 length:243 start_codon:yes stop_codon:yes gene_type:complete
VGEYGGNDALGQLEALKNPPFLGLFKVLTAEERVARRSSGERDGKFKSILLEVEPCFVCTALANLIEGTAKTRENLYEHL